MRRPSKYRKLPVVIEAVRISKTDGDLEEVAYAVSGSLGDDGISIATLEGTMLAAWGDYIIKGVNDEFYPCKPDIFDKTYEAIDFASTGD
jgi:hypothetical protein